MTAAYPAGTLVAALPAGALAVRRGPKFTLITGLLLVVISTVAFGVLDTASGLDVARFVEGIGGACVWARRACLDRGRDPARTVAAP